MPQLRDNRWRYKEALLSIIVPFEPDDLSDWFWDILQRANKEPSKLKDILQNLSNDELQRFALEFMDAASNLRQEPYTNYYQASEDSTADMSYWVVSQGKEFYTTVRHHPEAVLAYEAAEIANPSRLQSLEFVAEGILEDRLGEWPDVMEDYGSFLRSGYARIGDYWEAQRAYKEQS